MHHGNAYGLPKPWVTVDCEGVNVLGPVRILVSTASAEIGKCGVCCQVPPSLGPEPDSAFLPSFATLVLAAMVSFLAWTRGPLMCVHQALVTLSWVSCQLLLQVRNMCPLICRSLTIPSVPTDIPNWGLCPILCAVRGLECVLRLRLPIPLGWWAHVGVALWNLPVHPRSFINATLSFDL